MILVNNKEVIFGNFPSGELYFKNAGDAKIDFDDINKIDWYWEDDKDLFRLMLIKDYIEQFHSGSLTQLNIKYMPHGRMDRIDENGEFAFSLKAFSSAINLFAFNQLKVLCYHSVPTLDYLHRSKEDKKAINIYFDKLKELAYDDKTIICFPDNGALSRFKHYFEDMDYIFATKERDFSTGKLQITNVKNKQGDDVFSLAKYKRILIIDDICSYGGTFNALAGFIHNHIEFYGDIELSVFHLERLVNLGGIKKIYFTPSMHWNYHLIDNKETELTPYINGTQFKVINI